MKKIFWRLLRKVMEKAALSADREDACDFVSQFAQKARINLLELAYNDIGVLNYKDYCESGELFLLQRVLKETLGYDRDAIIFDIGANVGNYVRVLREALPGAEVYAFEPNEHTFPRLEASSGDSVRCLNFGFGAHVGPDKIYTYEDALESSHASRFPGVFYEFHHVEALAELTFNMTTIDQFCADNEIAGVDFIKIDTEGNELDVIAGAEKMISQGRIGAFQFEFGECNVFSRVFLRDFYGLLKDYNIYRLNKDRLVPMFEYNVANEIFRYQNLFAVLKENDVLTETASGGAS